MYWCLGHRSEGSDLSGLPLSSFVWGWIAPCLSEIALLLPKNCTKKDCFLFIHRRLRVVSDARSQRWSGNHPTNQQKWEYLFQSYLSIPTTCLHLTNATTCGSDQHWRWVANFAFSWQLNPKWVPRADLPRNEAAIRWLIQLWTIFLLLPRHLPWKLNLEYGSSRILDPGALLL